MDSYTRLRQLLSGYVSIGRQPDTTELQQCLQAVTSEQRYELVTEVRSIPGTAIHIAAIQGHTETISCILDSFTAEESYKLLKLKCFGITAMHCVAFNGHTQAMRCMLDKVSPEYQIQLLNTRDDLLNSIPLAAALSANQPETAALIRQYIETAKKNIKEKQERKQDLNNADSQKGLKREIVDLKEELPRLRAKIEEQEVLNQQKDQQIEGPDQQMLEMKAMMNEVIRKFTQLEQKVDVRTGTEASHATTEGHGAQLQQLEAKISVLQQQGVEQNTQIKANTEGISKNRDDILQQDSLFQKKPDQTAELPEDCCINPEQEVERPTTPAGEEVEEEDIDRGIQVIDN